ncbi:MAG: bifunctional riboflavin kinase/FAD synthetase [Pirellulales bacterium]
MDIIRELSDWPAGLRKGAVAIGNFDGVHRGHAKIIERLLAVAEQVNGPAVVFTFDPHPVRLLRPEHAPPPLTWIERKAELLGELGADHVIAYPTDEALLQLSPEEFFDRIVRTRLETRAMVEGPNFYFGRGRTGNIERLQALCNAADILLEVVEPIQIGGEYVSSSRVRKLIEAGRLEEAAHLLTRPYRLRGMVTHGSSRGHRIGFPTANVDAIDTLLPADGVYAGRALLADGSAIAAAINIGPSPTFGEPAQKVEVHLIDWHGALYGQPLEVDFHARLRDIQRFDGVEALKAQLNKDIDQARKIARSLAT